MKSRSTRFNYKNGGPTITDLSEPILIDILSRLPAKTVVNCRCVCKTWLRLLFNPYFAKIHFSRAPTQILGDCLDDDSIFMGELDESLLTREKYSDNDGICVGCKWMSIFKGGPSLWDNENNISFANGFFCISDEWKPFHIHNPMTGELVVVHQKERMDSPGPYGFGLGFSKKTNELKLVRLVANRWFSFWERVDKLEADIYTLSTNSWRSIGDAPFRIFNLLGPFVNGVVHSSIINIGDSIYSFDFEEEKFRTFRGPPLKEERDYKPGIVEFFEGCLCVSYRKRSQCALDIWVMNEYGVEDSWTKRYVFDNIIDGFYYRPYRLMKSGEILVVCDDHYLISYDPKGRSFSYIRLFYGSINNFHIRIFPFVPNFMRVQAKDQVEGTKC